MTGIPGTPYLILDAPGTRVPHVATCFLLLPSLLPSVVRRDCPTPAYSGTPALTPCGSGRPDSQRSGALSMASNEVSATTRSTGGHLAETTIISYRQKNLRRKARRLAQAFPVWPVT